MLSLAARIVLNSELLGIKMLTLLSRFPLSKGPFSTDLVMFGKGIKPVPFIVSFMINST